MIASATQGSGGSVNLTANDIRLNNNSLVSVISPTEGGNITSNSHIFIALENSDILANVNRGGNITITSPVFVADIFANGGVGISRQIPTDFNQLRSNGRVDILSRAGVVTIPDFSFLQNALLSLSNRFKNVEQTVVNSCLTSRNRSRGSFTVTGTGNLPVNPYNNADIWYVLPGVGANPHARPVQGRTQPLTSQSGTASRPWKIGDAIVEAQGIVHTADGRTLLTTMPPQVQTATSLVCH